MSTPNPLGSRGALPFPTVPKGEVVAQYESYVEAQQTVDVLAHADFPVDKVSIIGNDLKTVEHITGRLSWGRVALAGAASGAWFGIFLGVVLMLFGGAQEDFSLVIAAVLLGAGFGMLFSLVSYALTRRRRDYTSQTQVLATSYSVLVDSDIANRARNVLAENGRGTGLV
ncbi:general stress protein [Gryllotalpicola ginsengisoli]|uniref:general stress protein n=1 Tax=Gryllotalpicola ginsengisoli TaxID=444608 RepID=UPI000420B554|nr:general stress protein [Gryllotalpicola ginsengisoli]